MKMTSNRPYLIRAFYDWIVDNNCTPYVVVDAFFPDVSVPQDYVSDGQIVLNLAPRAVTHFQMDKEEIRFNTRFGGVPTDISFPIQAVLGIYARENGQGMVFQPEGPRDPDPDSPKPSKSSKAPASQSGDKAGKHPKPEGRAKLRVIK